MLFPLTAHRLPLTILLGSACGVTPLTGKIAVGEEAFVVGVGEASDGMTDLYAAPAGGGSVYRVTFTRLQEQAPRLSASGTQVVLLRSSPVETTDPEPEIVILNLRTMAEHGTRLPRAGAREVAWVPGDSGIVARVQGEIWASPVPPKPLGFVRLAGIDSARADSALAVLLGDPAIARVVPCEGSGESGVCVRTDSGDTSVLDSAAHGALRWGADSIGYFGGSSFTVRPLAGGRPRSPAWRAAPARFRELTYHAGVPSFSPPPGLRR